jgi:hypothetical protein
MAKGQMRSNREKKKPKSTTKTQKSAAAASTPFPTKAAPPAKKR